MVLARLQPGGTASVTPSTSLVGPPEPQLIRAEPNPFRSETTLRLAVPQGTHVKLEISDVMGRRVATLKDDRLHSGNDSVTWDGRDAHGSPVAPGIYFVRIEAGGVSDFHKLVLVR
jgi:hypothetical protein